MRTTLTLDDDVAAQLERLRRQRDLKFRELVNDVLRRGLRDMSGEPRKRKAFRTRTFDMGQPLINIDNVAETLGHLESEGFK
jgi:adenine C2-methylase RlmN of 23S rRNA A2503 and tRNA A37